MISNPNNIVTETPMLVRFSNLDDTLPIRAVELANMIANLLLAEPNLSVRRSALELIDMTRNRLCDASIASVPSDPGRFEGG